MTEAVSPWTVIAEAQVWAHVSSCGIFGGQNGTTVGFTLSTSVSPCNCHSASAPYSLIHLSMTL